MLIRQLQRSSAQQQAQLGFAAVCDGQALAVGGVMPSGAALGAPQAPAQPHASLLCIFEQSSASACLTQHHSQLSNPAKLPGSTAQEPLQPQSKQEA